MLNFKRGLRDFFYLYKKKIIKMSKGKAGFHRSHEVVLTSFTGVRLISRFIFFLVENYKTTN